MTESRKSDWKACEGGEIARLSSSLRRRRKQQTLRRRVQQTAVMAAGLLLCVGLGWMMISLPITPAKEIACDEVIEKTDAYMAHQLDEQTARKIRRHLDHCPSCRDHYELMGADLSAELSRYSQAIRYPVLASW